MTRTIFPLAFLLLGYYLAAGFQNANAALTPYTSRAAFDAAVGTTTSQDFDSFGSDAAFPVDVGDFELSTNSTLTSPSFNLIDAPPLGDFFDVNGTTLAAIGSIVGESFFVTFDKAVTAFGADFAGFNNEPPRTDIIVNGETLAPPTVPGGFDVRFFGFVSDTPFSVVEFFTFGDGNVGDGYGMDNVAYVPEPSALALLLFGLLALARRR